jgi:putative membrane protein
MTLKKLATVLFPMFIAGAALADEPQAADQAKPEAQKSEKLGQALSVLHAVGQWSIGLSDLAEQRAQSPLVKQYAKAMAAANTTSEAKMKQLAESKGIKIPALDPQTDEGKSVLSRMKGEKELLSTLEGDAFDKEYMTLVTNTQQSVLHFLDTAKAMTDDQDLKRFFVDMTTMVQSRANSAQSIMASIYGDKV